MFVSEDRSCNGIRRSSGSTMASADWDMTARSNGRSWRLRVLMAPVLVLSLAAGIIAQSPPAHAATIPGCPTTESALQLLITGASAGDTIAFNCTSATTIAFSSAITITQNVSLDASGATGQVAFDGGGSFGLLVVNSGVTLSLTSLTLIGGSNRQWRRGRR